MADEAVKEAADPVGSSFLAIADILDALTKVQPGIAGPKTQAAIDQIRTQWTPAPDAPPVTATKAPEPAHEQHQHQSHKRHGHE